MAHGTTVDVSAQNGVSEDPPLICPACGGANAPAAVFCAHPACHKALGDFKYVQEELKKDTSWHETLANRVVTQLGKPQFLGIHLLWFLLWVAINSGVLVMVRRFDTPPFGVLGIILAMETIFITGFVLISQNHQAAHTDKRAELDYEVNVLTFRKITELEETLQVILKRLDSLEASRK